LEILFPIPRAIDVQRVDRRFEYRVRAGSVFAWQDPLHFRTSIRSGEGPRSISCLSARQSGMGCRIPETAGAIVRVFNAKGTVCWDPRLRKSSGCNGPSGNGVIPGTDAEGEADFVAPEMPAGSLVMRTSSGTLWFSVSDRTGLGFHDNEGFFRVRCHCGSVNAGQLPPSDECVETDDKHRTFGMPW